MYLIRSSAGVIYAPALNLPVSEAELELAENKAGALDVTVADSHPAAESIDLLRTELWVEQDGTEIFRGRVLNVSRDMEDLRTITCEGLKGYLRDDRLRPIEAVTARAFLEAACADYNRARPQAIPFVVEACDELAVDISVDDYPTIMDAIDNKLLKEYGGRMTVRRGTASIGGATVPCNLITYTQAEGPLDAQEIVYGVNLLDLNDEIAAKDVYTAVLPLGKETDDVKLTVASVNGGKDYVCNDDACSLYGLIVKTENLSEIETAEELLAKGRELAAALSPMMRSVELSAVDLKDADVDTTHLLPGHRNMVRSAAHDLSMTMPLVKAKLNLLDPAKSVYTFSAETETMTQRQRSDRTVAVSAESKASRAEAAAAAARGDVAQIVDYAMETGSGSGWEWRKWKSGEVELFSSALSVSLSGWAAYGTGGLKLGSGTLTFPLQLTAAPQVWITLREAIVAAVSTTAGGASVSVVAPAELVNITADVYVRGTMT